MKEKHTPGPWYVVNESIYRRPKEEIYEFSGKGTAGDKPIAFIMKGWQENGFPVEANAKLIAAAPEMLKALQSSLSDLRSAKAVMTENSPEIAKEIQYTIEKVESAIKKATE